MEEFNTYSSGNILRLKLINYKQLDMFKIFKMELFKEQPVVLKNNLINLQIFFIKAVIKPKQQRQSHKIMNIKKANLVNLTFFGPIIFNDLFQIKQYQKWSREELSQLYLSVKKQDDNDRINWKLVSKDLKGRTSQQCKSMFLNVIKNNKQLQGKLQNLQNEKNVQIQDTLEQSQKGKLYLITKYYNEDYELVQQHYFKDYTVKQIEQIYNSLTYEFMKHYFLLDIFEKKDIYKYIPSKEYSFYQIAQLYNTVKICQFVIENQWYNKDRQRFNQVKLFQVKNFLDVDTIDMLEVKMLKEIYQRRNVKLIESNIKQYIISHFNEKLYKDVF